MLLKGALRSVGKDSETPNLNVNKFKEVIIQTRTYQFVSITE